jgi:putative ABC transport system ATP-binding protein
MTVPALQIENLVFAWAPDEPPLLDIPVFELARGEHLFLRGASGSGKSTLLGLASGVIAPRAGRVSVLGVDLASLSGPARDRVRADHLGVIFQLFNLLPYLSVVANVTLAIRFSRRRRAALAHPPETEARRLLARLGLSDEAMLARRVVDLSVGQQQRVAAARALIGSPEIVIADEPTSALDADTRDRFIDLLAEETSATGAALVFVSHDPALARHFTRALDIDEINRASGRVAA